MIAPPLAVREAALTQRGPVYVYDLGLLRARLRRLAALPVRHKRIHYATMANDHEIVLREIAASGTGIFVNSSAHLEQALRAGVAPNDIVYAASNMNNAVLSRCVETGVHIVLDSLDQVAMCDALAPDGFRVGLRVNAGSAVDGNTLAHEPGYRFGVLPHELAQAVSLPRRLEIVGLHCYFGTDIMDHRLLLDGLERLAELAHMLPGLAYIDGGGGFGICDDGSGQEFDLEAYGDGAARIMHRLSQAYGRSIDLALEPGRWLTAPIGWFFATVVDVKARDDRIFAGVDASVAQFPRMLIYPDKAHHPCVVLGKETAPLARLPVWVSGNSTYSRDFLARAVNLPDLAPGDVIAFANAGAYCRSMRTRFLGKDEPAEIVLGARAEIFEPLTLVAPR